MVVITHRGLFRYNRLPFVISSAPAILQRVMECLLKGISGVIVYLDDILITGSTPGYSTQGIPEAEGCRTPAEA